MLIFVMNEDDLMQLNFKWILYVTCVFNRLRMIFVWYKNPTLNKKIIKNGKHTPLK